LVRQADDEIEADVLDSGGAEDGRGAIDVFAAVHAAGRL